MAVQGIFLIFPEGVMVGLNQATVSSAAAFYSQPSFLSWEKI